MKNIIIVSILLSHIAFGQAYKIIESDIKQGQIGQRDGEHYVKLTIKATNTNYLTDTIRITISQQDPGAGAGKYNTQTVAKIAYKDWLKSSANKITFTYPEDLKPFNYRFILNIANCAECDSISSAFWPSTTGIEDNYLANSANIKETNWFDLNGKEIENPNNHEGVLIRKRVFLNGKSITDKIRVSGQ